MYSFSDEDIRCLSKGNKSIVAVELIGKTWYHEWIKRTRMLILIFTVCMRFKAYSLLKRDSVSDTFGNNVVYLSNYSMQIQNITDVSTT